MMKNENKFPREDAMMLYRGLVKDQLNDARSGTMVRKQSFSCERERMRVLEILSLLPDGSGPNHVEKGPKKKNKPKPQAVSKKKHVQASQNNAPNHASTVSSDATSLAPASSKISQSPYSCQTKKSRRGENKLPVCEMKHRAKKTNKNSNKNNEDNSSKSKRISRRDDEYLWHPIEVENKRNQKKELIQGQDVMKYYRSQYHHTGARSST